MQFKALDGVVRAFTNDKKSSTSHKCHELDKLIPETLGVSPAILDNVIFCHQEESNWPLQEGAVLKKRFDDIFESTRYTKALEAIRKSREAQNNACKELKIDLASLSAQKAAAKEIDNELKDGITKSTQLKEEGQQLVADIASLDAELEEYRHEIRAILDLEKDIENYEQEIKLVKRNVKDKLASMEMLLDEATDEQLESTLQKWDISMNQEEYQLSELESKKSKLSIEIVQAREAQFKLEKRKGACLERINQEEKMIAERDSLIERICAKYSIPSVLKGQGNSATAYSDDGIDCTNSNDCNTLDEKDIRSITTAFRNFQDNLVRGFEEMRKDHRKSLDNLQAKFNSAQAEYNATEISLRTKQGDSRKLDNDMKELRRRRMDVTVSRESVEKAQQISLDVSKQYDELVKQDKVRSNNQDIKEEEIKIATLEVHIAQENEVIKLLNQNYSAQLQYDQKETSVREREAALNVGIMSFNENYQDSHNLVGLNQDNLQLLKNNLEDMKLEKKTKVADIKRVCDDIKTQMTKRKTIQSGKQNELSDYEEQLKDLEEAEGSISKLQEILNDINKSKDGEPLMLSLQGFQSALEYLKKKEEDAYSTFMYQKNLRFYTEKNLDIGRTKGLCPCCHRKFDNSESKRDAVAKTEFEKFEQVQMQIFREDAQDKLDRKEKAYNDSKTKVQELESHRNSFRKYLELKPLVESCKDTLARLVPEIESFEEEIEKNKDNLLTIENDLDTLEEIVREWQEIESKMEELRGERHERDRIKREIARNGMGDGRTLTEVNDARDGLVKRKEESNKIIASKHRENNATNQQIQMLSNDRLLCEREYLDLDKKFQAFRDLEQRLKDMGETSKNIENEIKALMGLKDKQHILLADEKSRRDKEQARFHEAEDVELGKVNECKNQVGTFEQVCKTLDKERNDNKRADLKSIEQDVDATVCSIAGMVAELEELEPQLESLKKNSHALREQKRTVEENIAYRSMLREIEELQGKLNAQMVLVESKQSRKVLEKKYKDTDTLRDRKKSAKSNLEGRMGAIQEQCKLSRLKLMGDNYKDVHERYRLKLVEHETTLMAAQDLAKYYQALDKALQRYHSSKIEEINKIIRELWQLTYKGQDIDEIAIVAGEEGSGTTTSRGSRSYNYRVCMRKGEVMLDMRGRCSAGQRVLASIVIRLALAETFCIKCGFMALDEPTTNLDHENKVGLAHALARIISNRSRQHNFQLVVITHDDPFVDTMKAELSAQSGFSMPEYYWRISREELHSNGVFYSRIDRVDWEDGL